MARLIYSAADLPADWSRGAQGRRVLVLMSQRGTATQEAVVPLIGFEDAGVEVVVGSDRAGEVRFDGPCELLAAMERFWSPVYRYRRILRDRGLRTRAVDPDPVWLSHFDAVLIPGGHGAAYGAFARSSLVRTVVHAFAATQRVVALQCHSVIAATLTGPGGEAPIAAGREVTCWPAAWERVLAASPVFGRHFLPLGELTQDAVAAVAVRVHAGANPFRVPHVAIDGHLVTSWGPWSASLLTRTVVALIGSHAAAVVPTPPGSFHAA